MFNQKGKTSLDFTEARDSEWQWHQLGHMQVCTSLQTDNHTSTPPLNKWMDNIKTWTGLSVEQSITMTENRDKWRKYANGVANPRIEDG